MIYSCVECQASWHEFCLFDSAICIDATLELANMTENTIDLASLALNSSSPSSAAAPGDIGVCQNQTTFDRSLKEAIKTSTLGGEMVVEASEQLLPPMWQELPTGNTFDFDVTGFSEARAHTDDLDGFLEVRALVEAIHSHPQGFVEVLENVNIAPNTIASPYGEISVHLNREFNSRIQPVGDIANPVAEVTKTITAGAVPITENVNKKESTFLPSVETHSSALPAVQSDQRPAANVREIQTAQSPPMTRSPELISSTELTTHLRVLKSNGGGEARLLLNPAELGRVTVSVTTEGHETRVAFVVDNPQAKQAVEASLARLRELFDEVGLTLTGSDVAERDSENRNSQLDEDIIEGGVADSADDKELFDERPVALNARLIDAFV